MSKQPAPSALAKALAAMVDEYLSVREAAGATHLSRATIWRAIRRGELGVISVNGRRGLYVGRHGYRIHRDALLDWYTGGSS